MESYKLKTPKIKEKWYYFKTKKYLIFFWKSVLMSYCKYDYKFRSQLKAVLVKVLKLFKHNKLVAPPETGRKFKVRQTFGRHPGYLLNDFLTFKLCLVSRGCC